MYAGEFLQVKDSTSSNTSYSEEPKLVVRVLPSQMRFIKRIMDDMGKNRSDALRFIIDYMRFEHQTTKYVHSIMERHVWVASCEKRLGLTDKEVISWCVDFVKFLDDNKLLRPLLEEVVVDDSTASASETDDEKSVRLRSARVKKAIAFEEQK